MYVKEGNSVWLEALKRQMLFLLIQAHLKVRLCPAAVAKGAVSAESVALSTWCEEKMGQKTRDSLWG